MQCTVKNIFSCSAEDEEPWELIVVKIVETSLVIAESVAFFRRWSSSQNPWKCTVRKICPTISEPFLIKKWPQSVFDIALWDAQGTCDISTQIRLIETWTLCHNPGQTGGMSRYVWQDVLVESRVDINSGTVAYG